MRQAFMARRRAFCLVAVPGWVWTTNTWSGLSAPGTAMVAWMGQRLISAASGSTEFSLTSEEDVISNLLMTPWRYSPLFMVSEERA